MQSKDEKWFTRKKGGMLLLTLCLLGAAAVTTYYAMDLSEKRVEEEKMVDLNAEFAEKETKAETPAEAAAAPDVTAQFSNGATEMDVDPSTLIIPDQEKPEFTEEQSTAQAETENQAGEEQNTAASADDSQDTQDVISGDVAAQIQPTVSFAATESLQWPVAGTVLMDYSMDSTVYFATLDQYKYNPALILGAEEGSQVVAAAKGIVDSIATNEETGTTIRMNLGDGYELIYGQLKEVTVQEGDVVEMGDLLGYVSQPTKYYVEEGSNLYFALEKDGEAADPFLYLE